MSALADSRRALPLTITLHPSAAVWSSASKATWPLITALYSLVPWAVRKSTVRRWMAKLTGKISGCPPSIVTKRPNDTPDSKLQLSSSLSTITGSSTDTIQPNAKGVGAVHHRRRSPAIQRLPQYRPCRSRNRAEVTRERSENRLRVGVGDKLPEWLLFCASRGSELPHTAKSA